MARAVSATTAEFFRATHEEWGVEFDFNHGLASIDGKDGRVVGVTTDDGRTLPADVVVYGIGVIPNTEIAEAAGFRNQPCDFTLDIGDVLIDARKTVAMGAHVRFRLVALRGDDDRLPLVRQRHRPPGRPLRHRLGTDHLHTQKTRSLLLAKQAKWQVCYACHRSEYIRIFQ